MFHPTLPGKFLGMEVRSTASENKRGGTNGSNDGRVQTVGRAIDEIWFTRRSLCKPKGALLGAMVCLKALDLGTCIQTM